MPLMIKRYWLAVQQYKWFGITAFIITLTAAVLFVMRSRPVSHRAMGILRFSNNLAILTKTGTDLQQQQQQQQIELTEEMLTNEQVIKTVAQKCQLSEETLKKYMIFQGPAQGEVVQFKIYYRDADPQKAIKVTHTLMTEMMNYSQYINTARQRALIASLKKRLPKALQELRAAEKQQEDYEKRESASIIAFKSDSLPKAITVNEEQQRQVGLTLQTRQAQIQSIENQLGLNAQQAYIAQSLAADPILDKLGQQLFETESKLAVLRKDLRDTHPDVAVLIKQKETYEEQLKLRASEVLGNNGILAPEKSAEAIRIDASLDAASQQLAQTLINLKTEEKALQQQLIGLQKIGAELRQIHTVLPNKKAELSRLEENVKLKQGFYARLQASLADAQTAEAETLSSLTIAQPAMIPEIPPPKSKLLILALGGVGAIFSGLGGIFVMGIIGGHFLTWEDIKMALTDQNVELLGRLPKALNYHSLGKSNLPLLPIILETSGSALADYEKLRASLQFLQNKPIKTVLITSPKVGDGKSFVAYNLAIAGAKAGKRTLLIEANLRTQSAALSVGIIPIDGKGTMPLRYYSNLSENIRWVPDVENFYILPSLGPLDQVATVLESNEMRKLLADVRYRFDFVVVDAPALNECNDALLLEPYTDGMILVVRPVHTEVTALTQAIDRLAIDDDANNGPKLLGGVVNCA